MTGDASEPPAHTSLPDVAAIAFTITAALIVVLDPHGRVVRFNPAAERLTGHRETDLRGKVLWPFVMDATEAARAQHVFAHLSPDHATSTYNECWLDASGQRRAIQWQTTLLLDAAGRIELIVATGIDITEQRRAQQALAGSEARFRALFEESADGVVLLDPHDPHTPWRIVECNAEYARMNGYTPDDLIGQSIDVLHEDDLMAREGPVLLAWIASTPVARGRGTHRHRDGHLIQVESSSRLLHLDGQDLILGIDRDVTVARQQEAALRAANERLAYQSMHDDLTGLHNRATWLAESELAFQQEGCHAVLFLDLDGFKGVNDTFGHAYGDALLRHVAARVQSALRPGDLAGRLGGDEFVVLLDVEREEDARMVAARIEEAVTRPYVINGERIMVGVSLGLSLTCNGDLSAKETLDRADAAMYAVKGQRRR